jgi:hypothetical protein
VVDLRRRVPTGFSIRSPVPFERTQLLRADLPFHVFEFSIRAEQAWQRFIEFPPAPAESPIFEAVIPSTHSNILSNLNQEPGEFFGYHSNGVLDPAFTTLDAIMPPADGQETWTDDPLAEASLDLYVSPLYRRILFSVSNDFAGLGAYSFQEVIGYLQRETTAKLYELIIASSCHSAKAIVRNLFKGAIEAGDAVVVDSLLQHSAVNIDPYLEICYDFTKRFTPIERASALQHKGVVKVLLQYHVDINKSYKNYMDRLYRERHFFGRALNSAIIRVFPANPYDFAHTTYERADPDVFKMLLNAGGNVSPIILEKMIKNHDDEFVIQIMREKMCQLHHEWNQSGSFRGVFRFLRVDTCKEILQLMVDAGVDLNFERKEHISFEDNLLPPTIIDIAAGRADLSLIQILVNNAVRPTRNTLACAVSGGSVDVVKFF